VFLAISARTGNVNTGMPAKGLRLPRASDGPHVYYEP
jgi:hypothetical protein